ncbi:hypothetical protein [Parasitella parasitica]|uniref:Cyclin N-terminal domain-containing protein n=1 Tax=Parasitella parasitica TaxID=35722 RepID=A0A0B7MQS4_9FUNG|nr:hypothetical protein [Parasitella parasitica]
MKTKVNLYNRPHGRIDTYQVRSPYSNNDYSNIHNKQNQAIVVDRKNRLDAAYSSSYSQACLLLQAIQLNGRRRLSSECILRLANFVAKAWETNPEEEKIEALAKLMTNLMDSTLLCPDKPLDEALKLFCRNNIPTHSVSPSITLLIAIGYIERLKQKYHNIKGTTGCGHRLILVAYMMAAKFMHVNLRSIINTTDTSTTSPKASPISMTPFNNISAEKSTIDKYTQHLPSITVKNQERQEQLPSPPTSPKAFASDPLHYHYFQSSASANSNNTNNTNAPSNQQEDRVSISSPPPPAAPAATTSINHTERHLQILRMEMEFLHFLNYDLSLSDTLKLIHWAQKFDDDLLPPIQNNLTSGNKGGSCQDS